MSGRTEEQWRARNRQTVEEAESEAERADVIGWAVEHADKLVEGCVDPWERAYAMKMRDRLAALAAPSTPEPTVGDHAMRDYWDRFVNGDAAPSTEPALDAAWAEVEATLPLTGWPDGEGRWVLPSSDRSISLRWRESGDGYSEPHYEGWEATGVVYGFGGPDHRTTGDLAATPAAALRSLVARLAESQPKENR